MSVVGTHGTIERPVAVKGLTFTPPDASAFKDPDLDCGVCGYHQCDCAPKPGFEHWGRRKTAGKFRVYIRSDRRATVLRRDEGWTPAWGEPPSCNEVRGPALPLADAMRLADEKSPMAKPTISTMDAMYKELHARYLKQKNSYYRKLDFEAPPYVPVSGFNFRRYDESEPAPIPKGWAQVKSVNGFPAYMHESQNVGVVVRTDQGPKIYASCGVFFMATDLAHACTHALEVIAPKGACLSRREPLY